ncbi:MAG: NADAR family protein [Paludibacteraceae bacterium]|nr:NADAR family protein [Paludibacteraceae bacterium]
MTKIEYINSSLEDAKLRKALSDVVDNVDALIPQSESEFMELKKFGLYPAEQCVPFVTKQGTPFYQLDNMAMVPKGETSCYLHYGDFEFRQLEVLYNMARMDSEYAHNWLKDNLFQGCRVDARKKQEYKAKFRGFHRNDWRQIQSEWMKYCLMLKYRDNALFRKDLFACEGKLPVEDATGTNYSSNLFWGARLIELDGKQFYFGCNVLGKLLAQLRANGGKLDYKLPEDMHLFGKPIINI